MTLLIGLAAGFVLGVVASGLAVCGWLISIRNAQEMMEP